MTLSIKTSATLGILLAAAGFIIIPAAQADSLSGGPAGIQAESQSSTQASTQADSVSDSLSRGALPDVPNPNAALQKNTPAPSPAATRARTVRERQNVAAEITEISSGKYNRARKSSSRRISSRRPAKAKWKVTSYKYNNGSPQKVSTTYSTRVK